MTATTPAPSPTRITAGQPAPDGSMVSASGSPVSLASLWTNQTGLLALVFVRHFGCPLCRAQVKELHQAAPALLSAGITPVVIGMGSPADATAFARDLGLSFPVLVDPGQQLYAAYGLIEISPVQFFNPASARAMFGALRHGAGVGRPSGSVNQLGGVFLIGQEGNVRFAHPSAFAGDHPTPDQLVSAAASMSNR